MTIDEMRLLKKQLGYSYQQISDLSGVPLSTVQKVFRGATQTPRHETLIALTSAFSVSSLKKVALSYEDTDSCISDSLRIVQSESEQSDMHHAAPTDSEVLLNAPYTSTSSESYTAVREAAPACYPDGSESFNQKKQGSYTLKDYYKLPDDQRVELIDGVLYNMASPSNIHQLIGGYIYSKLLTHVLDHKGQCLPLIAPTDVQLDCDDKTMVEPDVMIVCDRSKIIKRCVYGAPDFIIEIMSPSTRKRDAVTKLHKYEHAGVREYWLVDPQRQNIFVYNFERNDYPYIYGFDSTIPVAIWGGACEIDFREVYEHIRFLYELADESPE